MKKLDYTVQFVTPAFLGNAEQDAQWRTPPFKTMLRQWWRILKAKQFNYNHDELRKREGEIFGTAADDKSARKSGIQIRLNASTLAAGNPWLMKGSKPIANPSLDQIYVGYGPVLKDALKTAIPVEQKATLSLMLNEDISLPEIYSVISLCGAFACLGSRSRNGWGSVAIADCDPLPLEHIPLRDLKASFELDWPHGVGRDHSPLIWKTSEKKSWQEIMRAFSTIRKDRVNSVIGKKMRPYISYPVTGSNALGTKLRIPSQLIFKARVENGAYVGYVVHLPHRIPGVNASPETLADAWSRIHESLDDDSSGLERAYKRGGNR